MPRVLADLPDRVVLALLIFGEARSEPIEGQVAVACVVRNRATRSAGTPPSWKDVCLAPKQFSCFSVTDPNYPKILSAADLLMHEMSTPDLAQALWIADGVLAGVVRDNTHGARNYLTTTLLHHSPPSWAVNRPILATIGNHSFLIA